MAALTTCGCGRLTRICRFDVTAEQWANFESLHRLAFAWAIEHYSEDRGVAEVFAERYAGDCWDDEQPPSFPSYVEVERRAAERVAKAQADAERQERRRLTRIADAQWRRARRRAAS